MKRKIKEKNLRGKEMEDKINVRIK